MQFVNNVQQELIAPNGTIIAKLNAVRTNIGTYPMGSEWTRNPIPMENPNAPMGKGRYIPIPDMPLIFGRGPFPFNIVDTIHVPNDIASGEYVVSWRWDAEQTKQVWAQCGDVIVLQKLLNVTINNDRFHSYREKGPRKPLTNSLCIGKSLGLDIYDCQAWVDLYDSLDGNNWPKKWSENCESLRTDPCGCGNDWEKHVQCVSQRGLQRISEIYLMDMSVKGVLPSSISNFTELVALSLVGTSISDSLPFSMGLLPKLNLLWLDHNEYLGGAIPVSFENLKLKALELHYSNFSGSLPNGIEYDEIPDCTLNGLVFDCPLPNGAELCGCTCEYS